MCYQDERSVILPSFVDMKKINFNILKKSSLVFVNDTRRYPQVTSSHKMSNCTKRGRSIQTIL